MLLRISSGLLPVFDSDVGDWRSMKWGGEPRLSAVVVDRESRPVHRGLLLIDGRAGQI